MATTIKSTDLDFQNIKAGLKNYLKSKSEFADYDFEHFFIQPMEVEDPEAYHHNIQASIVFCLQNPQWRLSLQTHKIIGIS